MHNEIGIGPENSFTPKRSVFRLGRARPMLVGRVSLSWFAETENAWRDDIL